MAIINIENITPGMVLASDVKDRAGRILLAAGKEVNEKSLRIFKMWGVTDADILGVEQEEIAARAASAIRPEVYRDAEQRARELFRHCDVEHLVVKELIRLVALRLARKMEDTNGSSSQPA
ncbi:MAG TPA: hypothetical protein VMG09_06305 [Bacteroidota bacterium]|nr:hypothetical protein [Bacteroidota bacterium]